MFTFKLRDKINKCVVPAIIYYGEKTKIYVINYLYWL